MPGNVRLIPTARMQLCDVVTGARHRTPLLVFGTRLRDERLVISGAAAPVYASARSSTTFAAFPSIKPWTCADQRSRAARRSGSISDLL